MGTNKQCEYLLHCCTIREQHIRDRTMHIAYFVKDSVCLECCTFALTENTTITDCKLHYYYSDNSHPNLPIALLH